MTSQQSIKTQIHDFVEGNLTDNEVDQLWAELIASPKDLEYLQTLGTLKKMGSEGKLDHLYDSEPNVIPLLSAEETKVPVYERFRPYLVAATVLIIGFAILFNLLTTVQQPQSVEAISMIEYEIERSADNQTILDNYLQEAVSLATNGNLEEAYNQLDQASSLQLTTNQIIDLKMVQGAIQYNTENYSDALATFQKIREIDTIDRLNLEQGTWYLANTQLQLGMTEEAIASMQEVIELDGAFSRVATQKLDQLQQQKI